MQIVKQSATVLFLAVLSSAVAALEFRRKKYLFFAEKSIEWRQGKSKSQRKLAF
jgi:hypothetical protein